MFLVGPVRTLVDGVRYGMWPIAIYGAIALLGAAGAALACRALRPSDLRQLRLLPLMIIPIGLVRLLLSLALGATGSHQLTLERAC